MARPHLNIISRLQICPFFESIDNLHQIISSGGTAYIERKPNSFYSQRVNSLVAYDSVDLVACIGPLQLMTENSGPNRSH